MSGALIAMAIVTGFVIVGLGAWSARGVYDDHTGPLYRDRRSEKRPESTERRRRP